MSRIGVWTTALGAAMTRANAREAAREADKALEQFEMRWTYNSAAKSWQPRGTSRLSDMLERVNRREELEAANDEE